MAEIPARFPATGTDTGVAITRAVTMHRIGLRVAFDGRLDEGTLRRAFRLSLDAEPVLGCEWRTDERHAYWSRLPDLDAAGGFSLVETEDPEGALLEFQATEVPDAGPQAAVALFRGSRTDLLGIKLSHVPADGQAAKQYAYLLADLYSRLVREPSFTPEPNLVARPSGRDVWGNLTREQRRHARKAKSWSNPTWPAPAAGDSGLGLTYRTATLPPERFAALKAYGKARDATVNDMLLTAVLRTCIRELDPPTGVPLSLMCTADLRRYLPEPDRLPISNISVSGSLDIERVDGEGFDSTMRRVRERMAVWAEQCYGAGPTMNAEKLARLGYRTTERLLEAMFRMADGKGKGPKKTYPWFTNIGIIDDERLDFAGQRPTGAHVYGPSGAGPMIVPVISTYRDTLTVCMGFCAEDLDAAIVESVLTGVMSELDAPGGGAAAGE